MIRFSVSLAIAFGVRATRNSRADAAAVTASRVCADSIVAIRTSNGSSWLFSAIFSTAGSSRLSMARASARITAWTVREEGLGMLESGPQVNHREGGEDETFYARRSLGTRTLRCGAAGRGPRPSEEDVR